MIFKQIIFFKRNGQALLRHDPDVLKKNGIASLRLFVPAFLSFLFGIYLSKLWGVPLQSTYEEALLTFLTAPFVGVTRIPQYFFRILFFSSPYMAAVTVLPISTVFKKKARAICVLLIFIELMLGLYYPILYSLYINGRLREAPLLLIRFYEATDLVLASLFYIYAYRLGRCFTDAAHKRTSPIRTSLRFFSYTVRILIEIIFLTALRTVFISVSISA